MICTKLIITVNVNKIYVPLRECQLSLWKPWYFLTCIFFNKNKKKMLFLKILNNCKQKQKNKQMKKTIKCSTKNTVLPSLFEFSFREKGVFFVNLLLYKYEYSGMYMYFHWSMQCLQCILFSSFTTKTYRVCVKRYQKNS